MSMGGGSSMAKNKKLENSMNSGLMQSVEQIHHEQKCFSAKSQR